MKEIDIEIKNSKTLSYLWDEIQANRTALDSALKQRAKDWEQIQQLQQLLSTKTCQCGKTVLASEFIVIHKDTGTGVCNWCYMHQYLPYIKEFSRTG